MIRSVILFAMVLALAVPLSGCVAVVIAVNERNVNGVDVALDPEEITVLFGADAGLPRVVATHDIPRVAAYFQEVPGSSHTVVVQDTLKRCADREKKCYVVVRE